MEGAMFKGLSVYEAFILATGHLFFYVCLVAGMVVVARWIVTGATHDIRMLMEVVKGATENLSPPPSKIPVDS